MSTTLQERHLMDVGKWRLSKIALIPALIIFLGMTALAYPFGAAWLNQRMMSDVTITYSLGVGSAVPTAELQLQRAEEYNSKLSSGMIYEADSNIPTSHGETSDPSLDYWKQLHVNDFGVMSRLKIPKIKLDLPVYHGTSDATLLKGLGHLRGTSLPVGGKGTRSVITGHRGLAEAEMFTRLDEIDTGDTFVIETFGRVLTYKVVEKIVVEPDEEKAIQAEPGRDLVTLVTCTPLGINSHRILVTGERIVPTPSADVNALGDAPDVPGFPWWLVLYILGLCLIAYYIYWSGKPLPKKRKGATSKKKARRKAASRRRKKERQPKKRLRSTATKQKHEESAGTAEQCLTEEQKV